MNVLSNYDLICFSFTACDAAHPLTLTRTQFVEFSIEMVSREIELHYMHVNAKLIGKIELQSVVGSFDGISGRRKYVQSAIVMRLNKYLLRGNCHEKLLLLKEINNLWPRITFSRVCQWSCTLWYCRQLRIRHFHPAVDSILPYSTLHNCTRYGW